MPLKKTNSTPSCQATSMMQFKRSDHIAESFEKIRRGTRKLQLLEI